MQWVKETGGERRGKGKYLGVCRDEGCSKARSGSFRGGYKETHDKEQRDRGERGGRSLGIGLGLRTWWVQRGRDEDKEGRQKGRSGA